MKKKQRKMGSRIRISIELDTSVSVRVWLVDIQTGEEKELDEGVNYFLEFVQKRPERCQACDASYPASEIVHRGSEQLCLSCDWDKYPIRDEDIPF